MVREKSLILLDGVAIGHTRQIVANGARPAIFAGPLTCLTSNLVMMLAIVMEKSSKNLARSEMGLANDRAVIHVVIKKIAQLQIKFATHRAVSNQPLSVPSYFIDAGNTRRANQFFAGEDDVLDLRLGYATYNEISPRFIR